MTVLSFQNLAFSFGERELFRNVNFEINDKEKVGFIGSNGVGKTTILKLIRGELEPTEGVVVIGKDARLGYMEQHTCSKKGMTLYDELISVFDDLMNLEIEINQVNYRLEHNLGDMEKDLQLQDELTTKFNNEGGLTFRSRTRSALLGLGFTEDDFKLTTDKLSGGQRSKVALAKLLLSKSNLLLLDEPTNYLDEKHIEWLRRYLQEYENAFVLISHDIPFLNSVVNLIYNMENQKLDRYVGDYDHFKEVHAVQKAQIEAAYNRQQQEIAQLKDFVARNKARVATRNMAMSRQKKLDKMDLIELAAEKPKPEFNFRYGRTPGKMLFETKKLVIGYDEPLSKPLDFYMERGQKIALIGTNGIGKTTLLKSLLGLIPPLSGSCEQGENLQIGYFEQEVKGENPNSCIEEIWEEFPGFTQYEVRSALAKCGLTTKHIESKVRVLSGGEQAKVRLCKLINRDTNVLLLDEPTNHLDVDAKDELKRALLDYRGSVLLICHEPEFYKDVVNEVWDMSKWTTKIL